MDPLILKFYNVFLPLKNVCDLTFANVSIFQQTVQLFFPQPLVKFVHSFNWNRKTHDKNRRSKGDGIGPEIMDAVLNILTQPKFHWIMNCGHGKMGVR